MPRTFLRASTRLALAATLALGGGLTLATPTVHALAGTTSFAFTSAAGDYIGQGATESFDPTTATFTTGGYAQVGATAGSLWIGITTATESWTVDLAPPAGQQLRPGTYVNALRAPFNGTSPGLSVSGDGRGCNNDYGSFTIYQLAFASNGALTQLDADLTQTCESTTAPPLHGTIRYQASPRSAVALATSVVLAYPGEPVTLTATVAGPGGGTPSGTVTFSDGNGQIGSATLDAAGRASVTATLGRVGAHVITAGYGGDATHQAAASAPATVTVEGGGPTTTWYTYTSVAGDWVGQGATASYGPAEATFSLSGTSTSASFGVSAGPESWSVQLTAPSGQTLTAGTYGNGTISVSGDGRGQTQYGSFTIAAAGWDSTGRLDLLDATFIASGSPTGADPLQGVVRFAVPLPATATALSAAPAAPHPGQATTLTATVTTAAAPAPGGSVTFTAGTLVLGTSPLNAAGQATLTTSFPTLGTVAVTATYSGDAAHAASTSAPATVSVQNPTVTTLTGSPLQPKHGRPVTLTAQVTSADGGVVTGTVTFVDGGRPLATASLDSTGRAAVSTILAGVNHQITASYAGDATDGPSTSNTILVTAH